MGFTDTVLYYLDPYRYYYIGFIYVFIFFLILCAIAYYAYKNDLMKYYNDIGTSNIPNASSNKGETSIMFFYTNWCPYSKRAETVWDTSSAKYDKEFVNGYKCNFLKYDLTNEDDLKNKKLTKDFKIEGYPTVKIKKGNDIIDFDAKITPTSLEEFIQNVTQE